jgi:chromate transport protein ChrA
MISFTLSIAVGVKVTGPLGVVSTFEAGVVVDAIVVSYLLQNL